VPRSGRISLTARAVIGSLGRGAIGVHGDGTVAIGAARILGEFVTAAVPAFLLACDSALAASARQRAAR
jgi:hypothetical protein